MAVELILLEKVENLGEIGDTVRVAEGYARNYLLPRELAAKLTPQALKKLEIRKQQLEQEYQENLGAARSLAERLASESVTIPVEANEQEKLYGSITAQQIVDALAEKSITIDRDDVVIVDPIRELGVYTVDLNLMPEVQAQLKVWIVRA
jgi:large subunit ribosomal protein L9